MTSYLSNRDPTMETSDILRRAGKKYTDHILVLSFLRQTALSKSRWFSVYILNPPTPPPKKKRGGDWFASNYIILIKQMTPSFFVRPLDFENLSYIMPVYGSVASLYLFILFARLWTVHFNPFPFWTIKKLFFKKQGEI